MDNIEIFLIIAYFSTILAFVVLTNSYIEFIVAVIIFFLTKDWVKNG